MLLERVPFIFEIVTVLVVGQLFFCWRCWSCCREARLAYKGVKHLYDWGEDMAKLLKAVGECAGCADADPTWPPKDPGDFPDDFE